MQGDGKDEYVENLSEGDHSDNDPALQPKNTYRYGLNGNLITRDGNHYSFESVKGTALSFTLPTHKQNSTEIFVPIGMFPMGDDLVIHSTNCKNAIGGFGEIGVVSFDNSGVGTYRALYFHADLFYSQMYMMGNEGYGLVENGAYKRNYYTDDFNQPRVINIAAKILNAFYRTADLIVGESYMVVTDTFGSVKHNGIEYGPLQAAGNIFTAVNTNYTIFTGSVRVIKLLNPLTLDYTPQKSIDTIKFKKWTFDGNLSAGAKLYLYQLYTTDGYESSWTFMTNPVDVSGFGTTAANTISGYQGQGYAGPVNTFKSITMTISNIPADIFSGIRVAVVECDIAYEVTSSIYVFWDTEIAGTTMEVTHYGQEDLVTLLLEDFVLKEAVIVRAKSMAITKQRQTQHNIHTQEQVIADMTGATVTPFVYTFPADNSAFSDYEENQKKQYVNPEAGVPHNQIVPDGIYVVKGVLGIDSVVYNGVTYQVGETFIGTGVAGVSIVRDYTATAGAIVKGCIRILKYYKWNTSSSAYDIPVYDIIELNAEFFGYTSFAYSEYLKGHWRDETYRHGYLFIDTFGNPMFVKWMADTKVPGQSDGGVTQPWRLMTNWNVPEGVFRNSYHSLNAVGMQVDNFDITDIRHKIGGVCIVRVRRDKTVYAQGIVQQVTENSSFFVPVIDVIPNEDGNVVANGSHTQPQWFGVLSPELDFGLPNNDPLQLEIGDSLKAVSDLSPLIAPADLQAAQPFDKFAGTGFPSNQIYSKFYVHNQYSEANPLHKLLTVKTVGSGATDIAIGFRNDTLVTSAGHNPPPRSGDPSILNSRFARGGARTAARTEESDFFNASNLGRGTGTQYADVGTSRKLLVNYVRPKINLYGGKSESAKANNRYQMCGHYIAITDELLADIENDSGRFILNGMQVFGGDCYVNIYDRVNALYDDEAETMSWGLLFPCESEINVALREGVDMTHNGLSGVFWQKGGRQILEDFNYNKAYSSENALIKYDAIPFGFIQTNHFPYLNRYSEVKQLGEVIDNMRKFLINNFKNVDALHGEVTKGVVINDLLFVIQTRGVTYLPIDERELISSPIAGATQLGVGGVMERFDTKDNYYGTHHKHSVFLTEKGICFWSAIRKAIVVMSVGGDVVDFTVLKGRQAFFNEIFDANNYGTLSDLYLDTPLLGYGVIGYYDPKHKTAFMTFKFGETTAGVRDAINKKLDFTVGMSDTLDKFVGSFSFVPGIVVQHLNYLFAANECNKIRLFGNTAYIVGSEAVEAGVTYVCIVPYTTTASPTALSNDTVHWKRANDGSQVVRFWVGQVCKFFGIVYPYKITKVFGSNDNEREKSFDNEEIYGNEVGFTDVFHQTSQLSSEDRNISSVNKNFKYINNAWWFSVALSSVGKRMFDRYMMTTVVVKNFVSDPTVSINKVKRIVYFKIVNRSKK